MRNKSVAAPMTSLTLVPLGGLCNRLRMIQSGLTLSAIAKAEVQIVWVRNQELGAAFTDMFMPISHESLSETSPFTFTETENNRRYALSRKRNLFLPSIWQRYRYDLRITDKHIPDGGLPNIISDISGKRVLIQSGLGFYPCNDHSFTEYFKPNEAVRELIQETSRNITPHTIGLHIRRSDNTKAIRYSPPECFEDIIRKEIERDPLTTFLLATDDETIKQRFLRTFPDQVITSPFKADRTSVQGMQQAAAELFALGMCRRFYGSYWSSFSDTVVAMLPDGAGNIVRYDTC